MKISNVFAAIVGIVCCLSSIARADQDADRAALRAIGTNYEDAANSGDLSKLKTDLSDQVTGVMVTGQPIAGYDGLVGYWKGIQGLIGSGGSYHVALDPDKSDFFGDIAICHGSANEGVRLASGRELDFSSYWTAVCHRENGKWKVFRMQATMDPVHNVFVSLQLKRAKMACAFGGFVAGAALMLLIQSFKPKTKAGAPPASPVK
ncbi:MAG TPA: DUF4440 domain-containing protein [Candidatus Sulfotelmatobacter sp.]|nr:DUF4440 domain-containing protein [Candidatus Sulfotelmatobacter sp.]